MPPVKGGVWTNIEDEILKAAISKYGLNQWARVSSLLARKTAKQCKARWGEWLDPGIRKVEWSRDEDEKLLHLAKLMPTQWRTIAPIVGRTATQCLERYQKLLDDAEATESAVGQGLSGPEGGETRAPTADDVRRLRPGELDPDPESKPAKPDTVDLDEDEKEMLSEARARLANTQGKKAKRKARERQLEESRRLAVLQKRRELKNSGINIKVTTRKKGEMDYNADIPFEKAPAPGFYDTVEEETRNEKQREAFDPRKKQLELKRKGEINDDAGNEHKKRKSDSKGGQTISAAAAKAAQLQKIREAEMQSKRRTLVLPTPQVSESELEDIVKVGIAGERAEQVANATDSDTTRGLVGNYRDMVGATPIRTPRALQEDDRIVNEVRNAIARTGSQSALLGGENAEIHEGDGSTGFAAATPAKQSIYTPNPLATPLRSINGTSNQSAVAKLPGATPLRTPRDGFHLNSNTTSLMGQTPQDIRRAENLHRKSLASQLAALPKPKETEWEFELPDDQNIEIPAESREEDASVRDRRNETLRKEAELTEFRRQSQVVQRNLPRPHLIDVDAMTRAAQSKTSSVARMVALGAIKLTVNDAQRLGGSSISGSTRIIEKSEDMIEDFNEHQILRARAAVLQELNLSKSDQEGAAPMVRSLKIPGLDSYDDLDVELERLKETFPAIQSDITASANRSNLQEKKLGKLLGGYQQRSKALRKKIVDTTAALEDASKELAAARTMQQAEEASISKRLDKLREEVTLISRRERESQEEYRRGMQDLEILSAPKVNGFH